MKSVLRGSSPKPHEASLIVTYTLAKALSISPLEIYKMPASLVQDLLTVHSAYKEIESEELQKEMKKVKK